MDGMKRIYFPEVGSEGVIAKALRMLLSAAAAMLAIVVVLAVGWVLIQFLPWIEPYLLRFYSGVQIGWGVLSVVAGALLIAVVIIWRS